MNGNLRGIGLLFRQIGNLFLSAWQDEKFVAHFRVRSISAMA